ncbi:uncharacterized protein BXZ73DRAFT_78969 [Epithele typhae]|uniref:uncharacterized protein n=1 Tax=Epithele typhae TaxID=378194 RepID=UPI0020088A67|nr:uncharacterized protein BXZ73DRAFT_78969 [Epithele typhae]KAH9925632.1 hypothetical protein BXZ73DRAFT_78969 [Epithele typhae]
MDAPEDGLGRQARVQSYSESLVFEPGQVVDLALANPGQEVIHAGILYRKNDPLKRSPAHVEFLTLNSLTNRHVQRSNTLSPMIQDRASTVFVSSFSHSTPHDLSSTASNGNAFYPLSFHARREQRMAELGLFHGTDASAMAFGFVRDGEKVSDAETEPVGRVLVRFGYSPAQRLMQLVQSQPWWRAVKRMKHLGPYYEPTMALWQLGNWLQICMLMQSVLECKDAARFRQGPGLCTPQYGFRDEPGRDAVSRSHGSRVQWRPSDRMGVELLANLPLLGLLGGGPYCFRFRRGGVDPENGQVVIPASIFKRLTTMYSIENGELTNPQESVAGQSPGWVRMSIQDHDYSDDPNPGPIFDTRVQFRVASRDST